MSSGEKEKVNKQPKEREGEKEGKNRVKLEHATWQTPAGIRKLSKAINLSRRVQGLFQIKPNKESNLIKIN